MFAVGIPALTITITITITTVSITVTILPITHTAILGPVAVQSQQYVQLCDVVCQKLAVVIEEDAKVRDVVQILAPVHRKDGEEEQNSISHGADKLCKHGWR